MADKRSRAPRFGAASAFSCRSLTQRGATLAGRSGPDTSSDGTLASPGHVAMFIGDGLVVEAPRTGDVVKVVTYASLTSGGVSALRHIA
jgi:hypothetical protein